MVTNKTHKASIQCMSNLLDIKEERIKSLEREREIYLKENERLISDLKFVRDLDIVINKLSGNSIIAGNGLFNSYDGSYTTLTLSEDVPIYVEDILDPEKKVIKQESNLVIIIKEDGSIKTGRTKLPNSKNRNYKLIQE